MKQRFSVIFDMDGTLLDTQRICVPAWEYAGSLQSVTGMGDHIPNVCGMNGAGSTAYLERNFPTIDIIKFKKDAKNYINKYCKVEFKPGAKELLDFLKDNNIKVGLASGTSRKSIDHHLAEVNITGMFDAISGSHDVQNGKPAPDVFLLTAERMCVTPESCFVFEDSPNGIRAAHAAGMKCIGVPDMVDFSDEVAALLFARFERIDEAIPMFKKYLTEINL